MKWGAIERTQGSYTFQDADAIVEFAKKNGLSVTGHTLIWHGDTPPWVFQHPLGQRVSRKELSERMRQYIAKVVSRYRGSVDSWDVVNEAISDTEGEVYRQSDFYKIFGNEEYIALAFQWAAEADPQAVLWYNDYNLVDLKKLDKALQMIRWLRGRNIRVDGIGFQGHYNINWPPSQQMANAIKKVIAIGLKVKISELDLSIYNDYKTGQFVPEAPRGFTAAIESQQARQYQELFNVYRTYRKHLAHVTFWGVADAHTWLDALVPGRKDYPLLFNEQLKPKKAFWDILSF
jgi:endo-1,4-beta-xylanase